MFFEGERIRAVREMILAEDEQAREALRVARIPLVRDIVGAAREGMGPFRYRLSCRHR